MADVKYSKALEAILEKLKNDGGITAERIMLFLFSDNGVDTDKDGLAECDGAKKLISEACGDIGALREGLERIAAGKPSFVDVLYIKNKLREAGKRAEDKNLNELTVGFLIEIILVDPPKSVRAFIGDNNASSEGEKSAENETGEQEENATEAKSTDEATSSAQQETAVAEEAPATSETASTGEAPATAETAPTGEAPAQESAREGSGSGKGSTIGEWLAKYKSGTSGTVPSEEEKEPENEEERLKLHKEKVEKLDARIKEMGRNIKSILFGQDNAINVFLRGYFQAEMQEVMEPSRRKPKATFLFAGPPGVGKTYLAETVAKEIGLPFKRFDMSEYSTKEATTELCGSAKVYTNSERGQLTGYVAENPKCILLFDEIEKAHISAIHLFLQVLDAGVLRDSKTNDTVSFKDTIIIFTSNAGRQLYEDSDSGDFSLVPKKVIINALRRDVDPTTGEPFFPAAICSRFATGNVVMFNRMSAHNLRSVCRSEMLRNADRFGRSMGVKVEVDEKVYTALMFAEGASIDARGARARAESFFNGEIYELTRLLNSEKVGASVSGLEKITVSVDMERTDEAIRKLFLAGKDTRFLLFADAERCAECRSVVSGMNMVCVDKAADAFREMKEHTVDFVIIDVACGLKTKEGQALNVDDVDSDARTFFKSLITSGSSVPVYMMERGEVKISEEERASFSSQGVRNIIRFETPESFSEAIADIADTINQQAAMISLARESKIARFETAQFISEDGKSAEIKLFDITPTVAVDAVDSDTMLGVSYIPDITFDMVIGADGAKKEMEFFVNMLKNPREYAESGLRVPKGILMYGPPGTGKTMLAKAMAHEAGVAFIATEGNKFFDKYVGVGEARVHEVFRTARKYAPAILFIDEIDAIGSERTSGDNSSKTSASILTALLAEMDGFVSDPNRPVFVLAATNFDIKPGTRNSIDEALVRRFDRTVFVDLPDRSARLKFLKLKTGGKAFAVTESGLEGVASRSTGMSLAKLDSVLELAMRTAMRKGEFKVTDELLGEALETYRSGDAKKWAESTIERVIRHESGHALLYWLSGETPSYLTVVGRGNYGGYMQQADNEDKPISTRADLLTDIRTSLGGRAAELVYYGNEDGISTGASADLASATQTAEALICDYGMSDEFGLAVIDAASRRQGELSISIRAKVNEILREQMELAISLIKENSHRMEALAKVLREKGSMNSDEIDRVLREAVKD